MVDVKIRDPDTGKVMVEIKGAKSEVDILKKYHSFVTESGKVIAEESFDVFDKWEAVNTGKKITVIDSETLEETEVDEIIYEKRFKTIIPDKKISDFFEVKE